MSFYTAPRSGIIPGRISGNALNGLCERVCILGRKIFDSCISQTQQDGLNVVITSYDPAAPTFPLTFVSASTTTTGTPTITDLVVTRFDERPNFARVQGNVVIPVTVNYTDAAGVAGVGTGTITIPIDVVMYVPQPSIIPYEIAAFASVVANDGTYTGDNIFTITACVTIILRVVAEVEILVPSYGYCCIPPCTPFAESDICPGVFSMPIFPTAVSPQTTN